MNQDILSGNWKQLRGNLRSWWGKLSDDDFEWIGGQKDRLIGLIQEKYGCTRDQAEEDVELRFNEYEKSGESLGGIKGKAYEIGEDAANRARGALSAVSDTVESASSYLRENNWDRMAADLRDIIRKYPLQSILLGVGLVYWMSRHRR
jgi:uncharacterized protein YjbJ (UPF0337 family)